MRVIAGSARGRRLVAPGGRDTRPTSDRAREALFSSLAAEAPGAVVLDLYAGSGALGIEALSRGAERAVFVESAARAVRALGENLDRTGFTDRATVVARTARDFAAGPRGGPFDVAFADPPYAVGWDELLAVIDALRQRDALCEDATVVVERDKRDGDPAWPSWLAFERARSYGDTRLVFLRLAGEGEE